jgi:hypothetical protein
MFGGSKYENSFANNIKPCHDLLLRDIETSAQTLSRRAWVLDGFSLHSRLFLLLSVDDSFQSENSPSGENVY